MDGQAQLDKLSHFESLFELLLEKQQETSENLQEIISERNSIWHEKIIPKIEQLYHKTREFHLNNEFFSLKPSRMDGLVKELIGREDEKQYRLYETRNIVSNQFHDLIQLIEMEKDYLNNLTNFSKTGEDAKVFLKIPRNLDSEGRIDILLNGVEENIRKEYKDRNQLNYYNIARIYINHFNKVKNEKNSSLTFKLKESEIEKSHSDSINTLRDFIEEFSQFHIRKRSEYY